MSKDISVSRYVWVLRWDEASAKQMQIFDDVEAAEEMAAYVKATRGVGTVLTATPVYGKFFVSQVTGKDFA
jgi:hypothetical protein